jgi:hypothetical protein
MNESRWEKMTPGDVVLDITMAAFGFAGEIAAKVRNKELARYFWSENDTGSTWEFMYFIVNEERTDVPIEKPNPLFGYQTHYRPQGFSMINEEALLRFAQNYGDIPRCVENAGTRGGIDPRSHSQRNDQCSD